MTPNRIWLAPAALGLFLVFLGILIRMFPEIVGMLLAFALIAAGIFLMIFSWRLRPSVTYRRMNPFDRTDQDE